MTAEEYRVRHEELMEEWERCGRAWLQKEGKTATANFYVDGVIDPETWFSGKNRCRQLFVLKEVHETNNKSEFSHQQESLAINFVANYATESERIDDVTKVAYDIWDGELTWRKLGALANGILNDDIPYHLFSKDQKDIDAYREILRRIAIINLKKFPGGANVHTNESGTTGYFAKHAEHFCKQLKEQIELIDPTIIICCGCGVKDSLLKAVKSIDPHILIDGVHPRARKSIEQYYNNVVSDAKNQI